MCSGRYLREKVRETVEQEEEKGGEGAEEKWPGKGERGRKLERFHLAV